MRKMILGAVALTLLALAQYAPRNLSEILGSGALPATCTMGDVSFRTDAAAGQNFYFCTALNTWTQMTGGGGGDVVVLKAGEGAATTSGVYAILGTYTMPGATVADGDLIEIYSLFRHSGGTTQAFRTRGYFGACLLSENSGSAAADLSVLGRSHIAVIGAATQTAWSVWQRANSVYTGAAYDNCTETISGSIIIKLEGRVNGGTGETLTLDNWYIKHIPSK